MHYPIAQCWRHYRDALYHCPWNLMLRGVLGSQACTTSGWSRKTSWRRPSRLASWRAMRKALFPCGPRLQRPSTRTRSSFELVPSPWRPSRMAICGTMRRSMLSRGPRLQRPSRRSVSSFELPSASRTLAKKDTPGPGHNPPSAGRQEVLRAPVVQVLRPPLVRMISPHVFMK